MAIDYDAIATAVMEHAKKNYAKGAWDVVVECIDHAEIVDTCASLGLTTAEDAIKHYEDMHGEKSVLADVRDEHREDARIRREEAERLDAREKWAVALDDAIDGGDQSTYAALQGILGYGREDAFFYLTCSDELLRALPEVRKGIEDEVHETGDTPCVESHLLCIDCGQLRKWLLHPVEGRGF